MFIIFGILGLQNNEEYIHFCYIHVLVDLKNEEIEMWLETILDLISTKIYIE